MRQQNVKWCNIASFWLFLSYLGNTVLRTPNLIDWGFALGDPEMIPFQQPSTLSTSSPPTLRARNGDSSRCLSVCWRWNVIFPMILPWIFPSSDHHPHHIPMNICPTSIHKSPWRQEMTEQRRSTLRVVEGTRTVPWISCDWSSTNGRCPANWGCS